MYNNLPHLPYRKNVKFWNKTALDCYEIGCNCENCLLYKIFFSEADNECKMKYFVQYNLIKIGKPDISKIYN